jgi:hypothetical protein
MSLKFCGRMRRYTSASGQFRLGPVLALTAVRWSSVPGDWRTCPQNACTYPPPRPIQGHRGEPDRTQLCSGS